MKRIAIACTFAVAAACHAGGPFDGIYKHPIKPEAYISVHQNGARVIMAVFDTMALPAGINLRITQDGGATLFAPPRIDHWGLISGDATGNYVRVQGESSFGGCFSVSDVWLNTNGSLTMRLVALAPTAAGAAQHINCAPVSTADLIFPRVF